MKLTDYPTINNMALTMPERNLLAKIDALGVTVSEDETSAYNPCSGVTLHNLHPVVARLVEWIFTVYGTYDMGGKMNYHGKRVSLDTFDRVRLLILKLDNRAYSELLD